MEEETALSAVYEARRRKEEGGGREREKRGGLPRDLKNKDWSEKEKNTFRSLNQAKDVRT